MLWMHGRTADKELDPGRYLRYIRRGINVCAMDLPGHGSRFDAILQEPSASLAVMQTMASEIDSVMQGLEEHGSFDLQRAGIGGMSVGGMAAIQRLLHPHLFKVAVLEATTGDLQSMKDFPLCEGLDPSILHALNPMDRLDDWHDLPLIAFHSRSDAWIPFAGQERFIEALTLRSNAEPKDNTIEFVSFNKTGAPFEHIGFGRESAFVKEVQVEFIAKHLLHDMETQ
ncbi:MAG: prolyl oligopeptidase family serine peptidase [Phycisphaerales bacterium]|nr:prolyl oligopeptidase family serine peptidase [Phycisphaerales bacterium]